MKILERWTVLAWSLGAVLTGAMLVVHSAPLGTAWWFGLAAGAFEGLAGHAMTRRGLREPFPRGMAWSLGGGTVRMVALLIAWRIGVKAGWPELESGLCMVTMYLGVKVAGLGAMARSSAPAK